MTSRDVAPRPEGTPGAAADGDPSFIRAYVADASARLGRPLTFFIETFGCQQNDHDSEIAAGILADLGWRESDALETADLILFNTCSVRANADDRFYGHVGNMKALKKGGQPIIGVFGCMMEQPVHVNKMKETFPFVDFLLGAGAMVHIPRALAAVLRAEEVRDAVSKEKSGGHGEAAAPGLLDLTGFSHPSDSLDVPNLPVRRKNRQRALITIMTGCNNFCTYCIVPYTRGREKSRPAAGILDEARRAVEEGARDIMLLGQNVNSYGAVERKKGEDPAQYPTFASLLTAVASVDGLFVLRYMTSHPRDLSDELIDVIGRTPAVEPHIHLPLQSGSDRILKKMNRHYDTAHYLALVKKLRQARPEITISTDLMVGFPGETEEDFQATLDVMEEARFDAAFTFIYSPRIGTPAAREAEASAKAGGDLEALVKSRFQRLVEVQNRLSYASNAKLEGKEVLVLVDGPSKRSPRIWSGRTRDNRLVNFALPDTMSLQDDRTVRPGDVVMIRVDRAKIFSLEGTLKTIVERSVPSPCR